MAKKDELKLSSLDNTDAVNPHEKPENYVEKHPTDTWTNMFNDPSLDEERALANIEQNEEAARKNAMDLKRANKRAEIDKNATDGTIRANKMYGAQLFNINDFRLWLSDSDNIVKYYYGIKDEGIKNGWLDKNNTDLQNIELLEKRYGLLDIIDDNNHVLYERNIDMTFGNSLPMYKFNDRKSADQTLNTIYGEDSNTNAVLSNALGKMAETNTSISAFAKLYNKLDDYGKADAYVRSNNKTVRKMYKELGYDIPENDKYWDNEVNAMVIDNYLQRKQKRVEISNEITPVLESKRKDLEGEKRYDWIYKYKGDRDRKDIKQMSTYNLTERGKIIDATISLLDETKKFADKADFIDGDLFDYAKAIKGQASNIDNYLFGIFSTSHAKVIDEVLAKLDDFKYDGSKGIAAYLKRMEYEKTPNGKYSTTKIPLDKDEQDLIDAYIKNLDMQMERLGNVSGYVDAGEMTGYSLTMIAEFAATGGLVNAMTKGCGKAAMSLLSKMAKSEKVFGRTATKVIKAIDDVSQWRNRIKYGEVAENATSAERIAAKSSRSFGTKVENLGVGVGETVVGDVMAKGAIQAAIDPRTYTEAMKGKLRHLEYDMFGKLVVKGDDDEAYHNLWDYCIEVASERSGVITDKAIMQIGNLFSRGLNVKSVGWLSRLLMGNAKYSKRFGVSSLFGEISEEVYGAFARKMTGLMNDVEWDQFMSSDNFKSMFWGMVAPSLVGGAVNVGSRMKALHGYNNAVEDFIKTAGELNIEGADDIVKSIEEANSTDEIRDIIANSLEGLSMKDRVKITQGLMRCAAQKCVLNAIDQSEMVSDYTDNDTNNWDAAARENNEVAAQEMLPQIAEIYGVDKSVIDDYIAQEKTTAADLINSLNSDNSTPLKERLFGHLRAEQVAEYMKNSSVYTNGHYIEVEDSNGERYVVYSTEQDGSFNIMIPNGNNEYAVQNVPQGTVNVVLDIDTNDEKQLNDYKQGIKDDIEMQSAARIGDVYTAMKNGVKIDYVVSSVNDGKIVLVSTSEDGTETEVPLRYDEFRNQLSNKEILPSVVVGEEFEYNGRRMRVEGRHSNNWEQNNTYIVTEIDENGNPITDKSNGQDKKRVHNMDGSEIRTVLNQSEVTVDNEDAPTEDDIAEDEKATADIASQIKLKPQYTKYTARPKVTAEQYAKDVLEQCNGNYAEAFKNLYVDAIRNDIMAGIKTDAANSIAGTSRDRVRHRNNVKKEAKAFENSAEYFKAVIDALYYEAKKNGKFDADMFEKAKEDAINIIMDTTGEESTSKKKDSTTSMDELSKKTDSLVKRHGSIDAALSNVDLTLSKINEDLASIAEQITNTPDTEEDAIKKLDDEKKSKEATKALYESIKNRLTTMKLVDAVVNDHTIPNVEQNETEEKPQDKQMEANKLATDATLRALCKIGIPVKFENDVDVPVGAEGQIIGERGAERLDNADGGIDGSGNAATFSMRHGWHAASLPTMQLELPEGARELSTSNGTVFGWADSEGIHLTRHGINPNTPVHEYTHLWAAAVEQKNPILFSKFVEIAKQTPIWNEVMNDENYADIRDDEKRVASEVLSRLTGNLNENMTVEEARKILGGTEENTPDTLIEKIKSILNDIWKWIGENVFNMQPSQFTNWEDVSHKVLYDFYNGMNPMGSSTTAEYSRQKTQDEIDNLQQESASILDARADSNRAAMSAQERKDRTSYILDSVLADLQSIDVNDIDRPDITTTSNTRKALNTWKSPLNSFDMMLRKLGVNAADGRGRAWTHFIGVLNDARDNELNRRYAINNAMEKFAESLIDTSSYWDNTVDFFSGNLTALAKIESLASEINGTYTIKVDTTKYINGVKTVIEEEREITLTNSQVMMISAWSIQEGGLIRLNNRGITDEMINEMESKLPEPLAKYTEWVTDTLLATLASDYRSSLDIEDGDKMSIEHYFPFSADKWDYDDGGTVGSGMQKAGVRRWYPSALKARVSDDAAQVKKIKLDIFNNDFFSLLKRHIKNMERHYNYGTFIDDIQATFNGETGGITEEIKQKIDMMGYDTWNNLIESIQIASGQYYENDKNRAAKWKTSTIGNIISSNIAFKFHTAVKQLLSASTYYENVGCLRSLTWRLTAGIWYAPISFKWAIDNMPQMKERWGNKFVGNESLGKVIDTSNFIGDDPKSTASKFWDRLEEIVKKSGMSPNAFFDMMACAIGAKTVYDYKYKQYKDAGKSHEEAHANALFEANIAVNATQQSRESAFLAPVQVSADVRHMIANAYQNSSYSWGRKIEQWKREMSKDPKEVEATMRDMYESEGFEGDELDKMVADGMFRWRSRLVAVPLTYAMSNFIWQMGYSLPSIVALVTLGNGAGDNDYINEDRWKEIRMKMYKAAITGGVQTLTNGTYGNFIFTGISDFIFDAATDNGKSNRISLDNTLDNIMRKNFLIDAVEDWTEKFIDNVSGDSMNSQDGSKLIFTVFDMITTLGLGMDADVFANFASGISYLCNSGGRDSMDFVDVMYAAECMANCPEESKKLIATTIRNDENPDDMIARYIDYMSDKKRTSGLYYLKSQDITEITFCIFYDKLRKQGISSEEAERQAKLILTKRAGTEAYSKIINAKYLTSDRVSMNRNIRHNRLINRKIKAANKVLEANGNETLFENEYEFGNIFSHFNKDERTRNTNK